MNLDPVTLEVLGTVAKEGVRLVSRMVEPTITAAGHALRERLSGPLDRLAGRVRGHREDTTERLLLRAAQVLEDRGLDPARIEHAPPDLVAAAVLNATASIGGEPVKAMFAGLLAGAVSGGPGRIHPSIPELIRQLDPAAARLLALLWTFGPISYDGPQGITSWERADGRKIRHVTQHLTGPAVRDRDDEPELSAAVPHLVRLGLAAVATWRAGDRVKIGQGYSETNIRDRSEVELTNLGQALGAACLGPVPATRASES